MRTSRDGRYHDPPLGSGIGKRLRDDALGDRLMLGGDRDAAPHGGREAAQFGEQNTIPSSPADRS